MNQNRSYCTSQYSNGSIDLLEPHPEPSFNTAPVNVASISILSPETQRFVVQYQRYPQLYLYLLLCLFVKHLEDFCLFLEDFRDCSTSRLSVTAPPPPACRVLSPLAAVCHHCSPTVVESGVRGTAPGVSSIPCNSSIPPLPPNVAEPNSGHKCVLMFWVALTYAGVIAVDHCIISVRDTRIIDSGNRRL